ncbi:MAG: hypothetical protein HYV37_01435 [Candidatus Levyibacteriota bacterium]|nr:MAG: hypothetical protein HYV37_01435 [Candidatus Levybacteria bacterium]
MAALTNQNQGMSEDTKTIITVLLLIFVFPVGVILMWVWMKWPTWVKILITLVMILPLLVVIGAVSALGLLVAVNPAGMVVKANDTARLKDLVTIQEAINNAAQTNSSFCNGQVGLCAGDSTDKLYDVKKADGTGWVKIKLNSLTSLPIDPINDSNYSYTYCSDGKDWEIQARVQSKQILEKAANDGGDDPDQYEVGTRLTLCQEYLDKNPNYLKSNH